MRASLAALVLLALVVAVEPVTAGPVAETAKKKCKKGHKWSKKKGKCVKRKRPAPPPCCSPRPPVGTKPPPASGCVPGPCTVIASDTAENPNPLPFWGAIDCANPTRYSTPQSGGDPHLTAAGKPQGNIAYRRTTVFDGDDFYGERCELGRNDKYGPVAFYHEGERTVTYFSLRLPPSFPLGVFAWQGGMQQKQAQESDGGGGVPILSLGAYFGRWRIFNSDPGPDNEDTEFWSAPAQQNVWTRWAWDVTNSQHASLGRFKAYVDLNADGDWADAGEQSPQFSFPTLKYEVAGDDTDGLLPGDSIPGHLRMGIYHDSSIPCPLGCAFEFDNVQVTK